MKNESIVILLTNDARNKELAEADGVETYTGISSIVPTGIYLLKVNNGNTRTMCEICSKLTMKTPEFIVSFFCCFHC